MKHKIRIKQPNLKDILTKDIFFKNYDQLQKIKPLKIKKELAKLTNGIYQMRQIII